MKQRVMVGNNDCIKNEDKKNLVKEKDNMGILVVLTNGLMKTTHKKLI